MLSKLLTTPAEKAFQYINHEWYIEEIPLKSIAKKYGCPCYVYSKSALETAFLNFDRAFQDYPHQVHYAVKANSNLAILHILANLGAGFDIVSQGELERVLKASGKPQHIIFSGVGKTKEELLKAIQVKVGCINVESESELQLLNDIAKTQQQTVSIALRVNPNIDSKSHPYISTGLKENKFGILQNQVLPLVQAIKKGHFPQLRLKGLACHIGSQILTLDPFLQALSHMLALRDEIQKQGIYLEFLNMGGGLGIAYQDHEMPPKPLEYVAALVAKLKEDELSSSHKLTLFLEPGRAIVAECGVLLTQVHHIKETEDKNFAIVDAGMNDLLRPALYQAYQDIHPVSMNPNLKIGVYDIVGPVCETADFLGKNRSLALEQGTLLAIFNAGAYGFSMSSNYNSRPRPPEIIVDGNQSYLVRPRETHAELFAKESVRLS